MSWKLISNHRKKLLAGSGLLFAIGAAASYSFWWPTMSAWIDATLQQRRSVNASVDAHAGHDHAEENMTTMLGTITRATTKARPWNSMRRL